MNQWYEAITALEQEGFKHEEAILLLREAELPNPGLIERIGMTIENVFGGRQILSQRQKTVSPHNHRAATRKSVT